MKLKFTARILALTAGVTFTLGLLPATTFAQGTAFTYQGRLNDTNGPVDGLYDFSFALFPVSIGGSQIGTSVARTFVPVTNGLFTIPLEFTDANSFSGADRWLEIAVHPSGVGTNITLSPRQQVTAAPYAIRAANLTGTLPLAQLPAGVVTNSANSVNLSGTFSGNGAGLTNLDVALVSVDSAGALAWPGNFALSSTPGVGSSPNSVVATDVNADGKPDLISANYNASTLSVLTNNGSGEFTLASSPGVGSGPWCVIAADVNADGRPDLVTANYGAGTLTVLTNNGSGAFVLASAPAVGSSPSSVASADVNGDNKVDLISANAGANTLTVLTNNGNGSFVLRSSLAVGSLPRSVAAADVNGDGKVDLVSANEGPNTLSILTNTGNGGFVLAGSPGVGVGAYFVIATDVNGDGKVDLATANWAASTLSVLTNTGNGTFLLASSPAVGGAPFSFAATDVNGDGKVDLISANSSSRTLSVMKNIGNGQFLLTSSPAVGVQPNSITAADVNGDHKVDLISANFGEDSLTVLFNAMTIHGVFAGDGSGVTGVLASNLSGVLNAAQVPNLDASKITSGTLSEARVPTNIARRLGGNAFTGNQTVVGGAVGIGTSFPQRALHVYSSDNPNVIRVQSSGTPGFGRVEFVSNPQGDLNEWRPGFIQSSDNGGFTGGLAFHVNGTGAATKFGDTEVMRIVNGRVGIGTTTPGTELHVIGTASATAFNTTSDRNRKENFAPVSPREVLDKVAALPISRWNFKGDAGTPHLGPVAQDFHAAFGLGTDNKHIATVDADGVALAAIQGLNQKLEETRAENAELKEQLSELKRLVQTLVTKQ